VPSPVRSHRVAPTLLGVKWLNRNILEMWKKNRCTREAFEEEEIINGWIL